MSWKRPHHTRWLVACALAFLIAGNVGGFSVPVGMVFLVIFFVGALLLSADETGGGITSVVDESDADHPDADYPDGDQLDGAFEEVPDESPAVGATPGEVTPDSVDGDADIDDTAVNEAPELETVDTKAPGAQSDAPGGPGTS